MFNYVYLLRIRNRLEENVRKSFGSKIDVLREFVPEAASGSNVTDRGYAPVQEQRINDLVKPKTGGLQALRDANPEIDFDTDWNAIQFDGERDNSDWLNPYAQEERDPREDYQWEIDFYERASTGDQYW